MSELEQGTQPILRRYEIPENEAHGCVSALYEDIRRILDLRMVNLIYRRMAGADGVLEWVWGTIRDTAGSCEMARHLSLLGKDPKLVQQKQESETKLFGTIVREFIDKRLVNNDKNTRTRKQFMRGWFLFESRELDSRCEHDQRLSLA